MEKSKKGMTIIICIFVFFSIRTIFSLKEEVQRLKNEIVIMNHNFNDEIRRVNYYLENSKSELVSKIERGESLLSSLETEIEYKDEQIAYSVNFVPKEKGTDETVFLSIGDEKKEAISSNGTNYIATFMLPVDQRIAPIISFESTTGVRQEVLQETNFDKLLSLGYECRWEDRTSFEETDKRPLTLTVYAQDERAYSLLSSAPDATIVVKSTIVDTEIGRKKMNVVETAPYLIGKESSISYNVDLSEYLKNEGSYSIIVELRTKGGLFYSEEVASYDNRETRKSSGWGSQAGQMYPIW